MDLEFHQLERRYEALRVRSPQRERRLRASLEAHGSQVEGEITALGRNFKGYACDFADRQALYAFIERVKTDFPRIDILINNAGTILRQPAIEHPDEYWDKIIEVNLNGAYLCTQGALPLMREQGSGTIVNISSMAGKRTSVSAGVAYCASKHGLGSLTRSINLEERRRGIRACEVCPGEVNTAILDTRPYPPSLESRAHMLQPEDVAQAVLFVVTLPERAMVEELHITPTSPRQRSSDELRVLGIDVRFQP